MSDARIPIVPGEKALEELVRRGCNFLSKVCSPAAEQFGLSMGESVARWRTRNAAQLLAAADEAIKRDGLESVTIHPRIAMHILDGGAWIDDDEVRLLWANLFAASCSNGEVDDSNLPFCDLLSRLTFDDAKVFWFACQRARIVVTEGLPAVDTSVILTADEILRNVSIESLNRLDAAIDHLFLLGLLEDKMDLPEKTINFSPTAMAARLFAKVNGWRGTAADFYTHRQSEDESA